MKIYALFDPRDGRERYVGKTRGTLNKRLSEHCQDRRKLTNRHKIAWLNQLKALGLRPGIRLLEECQEATWQERERFWIMFFGEQLLNVDRGGNGSSQMIRLSLAPEYREKISSSLRQYYANNPEARKVCADAGRACRGVPKRVANKRSRYVGVTFQTRRGRPLNKPWRAMIVVERRSIHLGYFATQEEAALAYNRKAAEVGGTKVNAVPL